MAATPTRPRGRAANTSRSSGGSRARNSSSPRKAPTRSARTSANSRRGPNAKRATRSRSNRSTRARTRSSGTRQSNNGVAGTLTGVGNSVGTVAQKAKTPAMVGAAAAAGLAGGMALGARMLSRQKGPRMSSLRGPSMKSVTNRGGGAVRSVAREMQEVGKEIGNAGFRLGVGDVSMEVKKGRKERRDSPLEVLLHGLTARREKRS